MAKKSKTVFKIKRRSLWPILFKLLPSIAVFIFLIRAYVSITKVEDIVVSCDISNIDYSKSITKIGKFPISINVANSSGDSTTTSRMSVLYEAEDPIMPHVRIFVPDFIDSLMSGSSIVDLIKESRCSLDFDECDFSEEYLNEFNEEHIKNIQRLLHVKYRISTPRWKLNELQSVKLYTKSNPIDIDPDYSSIFAYPDSNFACFDTALELCKISKDSLFQTINNVTVNKYIPTFCCSSFDGCDQIVDCYVENNHSNSYWIRDVHIPIFSPKRNFFSRCDISKCNLKVDISHIWNVAVDTISFSFNTATNLVAATVPPDTITYDGFDFYSSNKIRAIENPEGYCQFFVEFPQYKNAQEARIFVVSASLPLVFTLCIKFIWKLLSLFVKSPKENTEKNDGINKGVHGRKKRNKKRKVSDSEKKIAKDSKNKNKKPLPMDSSVTMNKK